MSERIEIRAFGGLEISRAGKSITGFESRKAAALLLYMAAIQRPLAREVLGELFWPNRTRAQILNRLGVVVFNLRKVIDPDIFEHESRDSLALNPDIPIWLDVHAFEQELRAALPSLDDCDPAGLQRALDLYRGDFLEGFSVDEQDFDNWTLLERERLRFGVIQALDHLVDEHARQGDTRAGLDCITRLIQIDSLREKTYRQAMQLLAQTGQRVAALAQYETCKRLLWDELGVAPSQETIDLYTRIRDGETVPALPVTARLRRQHQHNLPLQATPFVGRENEVQMLLDRLDDPECRLLTIVGPGGIGKTRLAIEVARHALARFADGVFFVPLATVSSSDAAVPAIMSALGLRVPEGEHDMLAYLLSELAPKTRLLVLDNADHLAGNLDLLPAILSNAPQVKLLVTSRELLSSRWEWNVALGGLAVPDSPRAESLETYDAVRLFIERARRVQHMFSLADDPAGVIRICRMVEGMPLGIELAAAWLSVMSCEEIAQQIVDLHASHKSVEARHQSLHALFENTWQRLNERERQRLMKLSVFRGGFTALTAAAVTAISLPELATLVHKSLLSANYRASRYEFHNLLNQFMRQKLAGHPDVEQHVYDSHAAYFVDFLHAREDALRGGQPQDALAEIRAEIDNVRAAWQHAVDQRHFDWVARCAASLSLFYALDALHHEALTVFEHALDVLKAAPESLQRDQADMALHSGIATALIATYGWTYHRLWSVAEHLHALSARLGDDRHHLASLILLIDLYANEEWEKAATLGQEAVTLGHRLGQQTAMVGYVVNEASLIFTGRLSSALQHARSGQALFDPDNCQWATLVLALDPLVTSLSHSGLILGMMGYLDQGWHDLAAAHERADLLAHPFASAFVWAFKALWASCAGENDVVMTASRAVIELGEQHGFKHWIVMGPSLAGMALVQAGDYDAGIEALTTAIQGEIDYGLAHYLTCWYALLGYAYGMTGRIEQGLHAVGQAFAVMERVAERVHESLIYRVKGDLLLLRGDDAGAMACFEHAIRVAQEQHARMYELEATIRLCELLRQKNRGHEARARLLPIYQWFTEGLNTPHLVKARTLLEALS